MSRVEEVLPPVAEMSSPSTSEAPCSLTSLYEEDEIAWLERSVEMIEAGDTTKLDFLHLAEFLQDMAIAQRREVQSRLVTLLMHLLKWTYQPSNRGASWTNTIQNQRLELELIFKNKTLRRHGESIISESYDIAVRYASTETRMKRSDFPDVCPFSLDEALSIALDECDDEDSVHE